MEVHTYTGWFKDALNLWWPEGICSSSGSLTPEVKSKWVNMNRLGSFWPVCEVRTGVWNKTKCTSSKTTWLRLLVADDVVMLALSFNGLQCPIKQFYSRLRMRISTSKSEVMVPDRNKVTLPLPCQRRVQVSRGLVHKWGEKDGRWDWQADRCSICSDAVAALIYNDK